MAFVKAGHQYYYNNLSGALYPWSPDLEKVKGLTLFTAGEDGTFDTSMLSAEKQPAAPAPAAPAPVAKSKVKTVKYVGAEPPKPAVNTVEVPTSSGSATVPAVNLTPSDQSDE